MDSPKLQQFVAREQQVQETRVMIELLTETCWNKCVGYPSNRLDSKTETCIRNCVSRYVDTTNYVGGRMTQQMQRMPNLELGSSFS